MGTKILAGELKGFEVPVPKGVLIRPLLARTKKSLFDILKNQIAGSSFLDLFSGSGAVGLEALSRGAERVVFIDAHPLCQRSIERTLRGFAERNMDFFKGKEWGVHRADVLRGLNWLNHKFDLVFSGAPYKDDLKKPLSFLENLLEMIARDQILSEQGIIITQHHKKEMYSVPPSLTQFRQERYGDTFLSFFRRAR